MQLTIGLNVDSVIGSLQEQVRGLSNNKGNPDDLQWFVNRIDLVDAVF